jgi:uncharacterized membrane-anchored protein YjiN (DUF445 family)
LPSNQIWKLIKKSSIVTKRFNTSESEEFLDEILKNNDLPQEAKRSLVETYRDLKKKKATHQERCIMLESQSKDAKTFGIIPIDE